MFLNMSAEQLDRQIHHTKILPQNIQNNIIIHMEVKKSELK